MSADRQLFISVIRKFPLLTAKRRHLTGIVRNHRITESNITKANDDDLEFRTVVQNMVNKEQHLKMSFRIIGADGITVKYSEEQEFTIPALTNSYNPDAARESLSIVLHDVYGLTKGDRLDGKIVDMDTQEVLATVKTANQHGAR